VYFSNVTVASDQSLIILENFSNLHLSNHTYRLIENSDSQREGSSIIKLPSIKVDNDNKEILIEVEFY
jgi:hypothetical protein